MVRHADSPRGLLGDHDIGMARFPRSRALGWGTIFLAGDASFWPGNQPVAGREEGGRAYSMPPGARFLVWSGQVPWLFRSALDLALGLRALPRHRHRSVGPRLRL